MTAVQVSKVTQSHSEWQSKWSRFNEVQQGLLNDRHLEYATDSAVVAATPQPEVAVAHATEDHQKPELSEQD